MGIAVLFVATIVALVFAGYVLYGIFLGITRLVKLLTQGYKWLISSEEEPSAAGPGAPAVASALNTTRKLYKGPGKEGKEQ